MLRQSFIVMLLLLDCINAFFTDTVPPWSCSTFRPIPLNTCLSHAVHSSPLLQHSSGTLLGHGFSGAVHSFPAFGSHPALAVKTFASQNPGEDTDTYLSPILNEYNLASLLSHHPGIIKTYDLFTDGQHWHQSMEYAPFRLQDLVTGGKLSKDEVDCVFAEIFDVVNYMHGLGVAHLDLKMSNVMVGEDGRVRVIDFGSAVKFQVEYENDVVFVSGEWLLYRSFSV